MNAAIKGCGLSEHDLGGNHGWKTKYFVCCWSGNLYGFLLLILRDKFTFHICCSLKDAWRFSTYPFAVALFLCAVAVEKSCTDTRPVYTYLQKETDLLQKETNLRRWKGKMTDARKGHWLPNWDKITEKRPSKSSHSFHFIRGFSSQTSTRGT